MNFSKKNIYVDTIFKYDEYTEYAEIAEIVQQTELEIVSPKFLAASEIDCLARNMYFEARGEPNLGLIAVAYVTMNRVKSEFFPDTICGVVFEPYQFSWTNDEYSNTPPNNETWEKIYKLAETFIINYPSLKNYDITKNALFFHANYVNPNWKSAYTKVVQIGKHLFYNNMKET